ncbi:hypothetical protein F5Y18DRAFT_355451 [Xylariaceae sp. FL1019]|nr:hypothetical protein F5Y18DRAFT_355451 [Xylariaceae sp. FL1019]
MYRAAVRSAPRLSAPLRQPLAASGRRFASTVPADRRRSWKSSFVRWGLAVGAVYWYSTAAVFAEQPQLSQKQPPPHFSDEDLPTIEAVVAEKRKEAEARLHKAAAKPTPVAESETTIPAAQISPEAPANDVEGAGAPPPPPQEGGLEGLEEEAGQQGAFNPETGEINWDCPCLGGMADGPCGEQFKAAFSCFVYSKDEPKGIDCIDKFQHMQDCFRLHPEIYGEELEGDEEAGEGAPADAAAATKDIPENSNPAQTSERSAAPEPPQAAASKDVNRENGEREPGVDHARDATDASAPKKE